MQNIGNTVAQSYRVNQRSVRVVADYDNDEITIMTYGYKETFDMDDYNNFQGNMEEFVRAKLTEVGVI